MTGARTGAALDDAGKAFRNVFARANAVDPFAPHVEGRLLLYPIDYVRLDKPQFEALAEASANLGGATAYLAAYGEGGGWEATHSHYLIALDDYATYRALSGQTLEHFLFDAGGEWGLVTADGGYALLGGSGAFSERVRHALGYDQHSVMCAFVKDWREEQTEGARVDWVPTVLDHLLGPGQGTVRWARGC
jgi:hypothetical protein